LVSPLYAQRYALSFVDVPVDCPFKTKNTTASLPQVKNRKAKNQSLLRGRWPALATIRRQAGGGRECAMSFAPCWPVAALWLQSRRGNGSRNS
jgi:hypothetical protein